MCEYCNIDVDNDVYPEPILHAEKQGLLDNMLFEVEISPKSNDKLVLSFAGEKRYNWEFLGEAKIHYCPMCGRKL